MHLRFLSRILLSISTSFVFIEVSGTLVILRISYQQCGNAQDPKTFVSFSLSMTALGWDEIMTGVEGKEWRYEIQHGKKELGKIYVLKDVYMNDERDPEHDIYRETIDSVKDIADVTYLKAHLRTPYDAWMATVKGEEDHTVEVMMHDIPTDAGNVFKLVAKEEGSTGPLMAFDEEPHEKAYLATRSPPRPILKVAGRKHYRTVFEKVATPIWQLTNLRNVLLVLMQSTEGTFYGLLFLIGLMKC